MPRPFPLPMGVPGWDRDARVLEEQRAADLRVIAEAQATVRFVGDSITLGSIIGIADGLRLNGMTLKPRWVLDEKGFIIGLSLVEPERGS